MASWSLRGKQEGGNWEEKEAGSVREVGTEGTES